MTFVLVAAAAVLQSAVSQVTVFSDRARVVRTAIAPAGALGAEFPLLPDAVDPSSIRVAVAGDDSSAQAAELQRIDIAHVEPDAFPADEARALLERLERMDDRIALMTGQRDDYGHQLEALRKIAPRLPSDSLKPPPRLNPRGWNAGFSFERSALQENDAHVRQLAQQLDELGRERQQLAARAFLLGGARRRSGFRVTAWLSGAHAAHLILTYLVGHARWMPGYDLQLLKDQKSVRVAFSGAVSQESGEDWTNARLTLSTAVPATERALPEIATWKIGDRERFLPQTRRTFPPRPQPGLVSGLVSGPQWPPKPEPQAEASDALRKDLLARAASQKPAFSPPPPLPAAALFPAPPPPPAPEVAEEKSAGEEIVVTGSRIRKTAQGPTPDAVMVTRKERGRAPEEVVVNSGSDEPAKELAPDSEFAIAPPPSWTPPQPSPGSPADAAGGYQLEYSSLRPETIQSGRGLRRVLLFSETWPVAAERVLYPGVSSDAYLIARIKNPSLRILPRANAQLTVGQDLAGIALLPLMRPGVEVELPLGVDRAIHTQRNVAQVQSEQGLFSKDDVTRYLVTIEVANPYPAAVSLRVIDQYPLTGDNHMEVELLEAPCAQVDKAIGKLTWTLQVAPAEKVKLGFIYQLKRPKGFRVHQ